MFVFIPISKPHCMHVCVLYTVYCTGLHMPHASVKHVYSVHAHTHVWSLWSCILRRAVLLSVYTSCAARRRLSFRSCTRFMNPTLSKSS